MIKLLKNLPITWFHLTHSRTRHMVAQVYYLVPKNFVWCRICVYDSRGDDIDAACGQLVGQVAAAVLNNGRKKWHSVKRFYRIKLREDFEYSEVKDHVMVAVAFLASGCQTSPTLKRKKQLRCVRSLLQNTFVLGLSKTFPRPSSKYRESWRNMMMGILLQQEGSKPNLENIILNVQFLLSQIMLRRLWYVFVSNGTL